MNPLAKLFVKAHAAIYHLSGGKIGRQLGSNAILVLHSVGAKCGKRRTSPLVYFEDNGNYVIIASNGGAPQHPSWYHNLLAQPSTTAQIGDDIIAVKAEIAEPVERRRLWEKFVPGSPQFQGYQDRTERQIPVVVLKPM